MEDTKMVVRDKKSQICDGKCHLKSIRLIINSALSQNEVRGLKFLFKHL